MRRRWDVNRIISMLLLVAAVALIVPWAWNAYQTRPAWVDPIVDYMIHTGLKNTARMGAFAVLGAGSIGILFGTLMTIRFRPLRALIRGYIEVFRGLPIIITMFLIYFAVPRVVEWGFLERNAFQAATIGLILWGSAQVAEATRGAVQSIPREQHEAAAALGFGWVGRHAFVVLPQAFRRLLPPLVGLLVNVIQNTTIASILGVAEVLETGQRSTERLLFTTGDSHAFAIFGGVMVLFFAISFPLTQLARFLERRLV